MEYYTLLQLKREPFSNSPDPDYFFQSQQHQSCLQKLELALRLKRGLNVVIGDVGTGKTTLCRELIRRFAQEPDIETHLILDPSFHSSAELLSLLHKMLCKEESDGAASEMKAKEQIKQTLFEKGVDQKKTIILIIDEGQKISSSCVEVLRELLNYETNRYKLLQIVIFAQQEFEAILQTHANFTDRVNLLHHLAPMSFSDTRRMIHHRLKLSSKTAKPIDLFTLPALWAIYRVTKGYPRKIIHLCHQSVLAMIIQNRRRAGWALVRSCKSRLASSQNRFRGPLIAGGSILLVILVVVVLWPRYTAHEASDTSGQTFKIPEAALGKSPLLAPAALQEPDAESRPIALPLRPVTATSHTEIKAPEPEAQGQPSAAQNPNTRAARPVYGLTDAPASPPLPDKAEPPALLGKLAVKPGDTLLRLIRTVYGTTASRYVRSVIEANPDIKNPNVIDLDDVVVFPALPFRIDPTSGGRIWVVLDDRTTLAKARSRLDELMAVINGPARLAALWTPSDGLQFALVAEKSFNAEQDARDWINGLPSDIAQKARIQSGWPRDTLFYSSFEARADG